MLECALSEVLVHYLSVIVSGRETNAANSSNVWWMTDVVRLRMTYIDVKQLRSLIILVKTQHITKLVTQICKSRVFDVCLMSHRQKTSYSSLPRKNQNSFQQSAMGFAMAAVSFRKLYLHLHMPLECPIVWTKFMECKPHHSLLVRRYDPVLSTRNMSTWKRHHTVIHATVATVPACLGKDAQANVLLVTCWMPDERIRSEYQVSIFAYCLLVFSAAATSLQECLTLSRELVFESN